ncbi:DMT family transporter [Chitinophagaceae bacterium LWZ2-11]
MKRALILLHLSVLLAGFTGVFGRLISLNEGLITWYRLFFSGIILLLIMLFSNRLKKISIKNVIRIGSAGCLLGLHWVFFYGSIKYSNISLGVVCFSLCSFFTAILEPIINKRKFAIQELLLSGLTLCGIILIFGLDATHRTGIILGVISSILVALFTISNERLTKKFETRTITLYEMIGGCIGLSILMPLYLYFFPVDSLLPSSKDLGYLLLLSLFCTVLMYLMITEALSKVSAFTVNLSFNLEPLYSIILAILLYHENKEFTWAFYIGLGLIITSVLLQMFRVTRKIQI